MGERDCMPQAVSLSLISANKTVFRKIPEKSIDEIQKT